MGGQNAIVQISHWPRPEDGDGYWETGRGVRLSAMYGELLGMVPIDIGYHKLVYEDGRVPDIGFEYSPHDVPPRWPDPDHPQQVHLDIAVRDLDVAEELVIPHGATPLRDDDEHRVLADLMGHPFCLYPDRAPDPSTGAPHGRIARIVFDCFSPRAPASFYEEFLDMRRRVLDTMERVEVAGGATDIVLAFQHSRCQPPRWPTPRLPGPASS